MLFVVSTETEENTYAPFAAEKKNKYNIVRVDASQLYGQ